MSWVLLTLLAEAGVEATTSENADIGGLAYDSRAVVPRDLFCCIPGARADGHEHAREAVTAGAAAVLVERAVEAGVPQARVGHVREVLGPLADTFFGHPSTDMRVAGVTGTNGKTTVTYLLESIAGAAGLRPGVVGTVRYRIGDVEEPALRTTPEAIDLQRLLARMRDAGTDVVAMEVASHALDQDRVKAIRFACAAFTNLTQDHLDYHEDMESYFEAKAKLFAMTDSAVINTADPYGRRLLEQRGSASVLTFAGDGADVGCESAEYTQHGTYLTLRTPSGTFGSRTYLVGPYNVDNVLCATALAIALEIPLDAIVAGIERVRVVPGRLEPVTGAPFTVLVDYAHTPDALGRAIGAMRSSTTGRLIVVFGCGGDRDRSKRPLMGEAATRGADLTIVTSDNPRSEDPVAIIEDIRPGAERGGGDYRVVADRREAIASALADADPGDVVLVAGKGHEQGQTFGDTTLPFDDREVVRELVADWGCRA